MGSFIIYVILFLVVVYGLASILTKYKRLAADSFHPRVVYRVVGFVALLYQIVLLLHHKEWAFSTYLMLVCTSASFFIALDVVDAIRKKRQRKNIGYPRGLHGDQFYSKAFLFMYAIGWLWRLYALVSGLLYGTFLATQLETTSYSNLFGIFNAASLLFFFGHLIFTSARKFPLFGLLLLSLELGWIFVSGSKAAILYVLLPTAFIAQKRQWIRMTPKLIILGGIVSLLVLQLSFTLITAYRISVKRGAFEGQSLDISLVSESLGEAFSSSFGGNNQDDASAIMNRLNWAEFYGALLDRPDVTEDRWYGRSYIPIVSWWIPRFVWPDKPNVSVGLWYGEEVLGWDYDTRSEGAITIWGDAFMNFGAVGAMTVSLLWFSLIFGIYDYFGSRGSWGLLIIATVYMRMIIGMEQNLAVPLVAMQLQIVEVYGIKLGLGSIKDFFKRSGRVN